NLHECLNISQGVMNRVVIVLCRPPLLPLLGVRPLTGQARVEIADPAPTVTEGIRHAGLIEQARYPHPVVRDVVADEYRIGMNQLVQPAAERLGYLLRGGYLIAHEWDSGVVRIGPAFVQHTVKGPAAVVMDGTELGHDPVHRTRPASLCIYEDQIGC